MIQQSFLRKALFTLTFLPLFSYGQETKSSDDLFLEARHKSFEEKDYTAAKKLALQALAQSPEYTDIAVFLGRIYTWNDETDEARKVFQNIEKTMDPSTDFYLAYTSLEYWNENYTEAISIIDRGLIKYPKHEELLLLKAKIQNSGDLYSDASETIKELIAINPKNTEARELANRIEINNTKNAVGVNYNYSHFDKQFADDWHQVSVSYKRQTSLGSLIFKVNYANKFKDNGVQYEVEAYPRLSKTFYMYIGGGYSDSDGIFPEYRTGASLYANLPKSFEAELGYRQLHFSDDVWMFTGSIGKYYKNYWFNLRAFVTPSDHNISHSYTFTTRYYTGDANNYLSLAIGTGISPEDFNNNLLENTTYKLKSFKIGANYNFSINDLNLFSIGANYYNQEYRPNQKGNQYDVSVSYSRKF